MLPSWMKNESARRARSGSRVLAASSSVAVATLASLLGSFGEAGAQTATTPSVLDQPARLAVRDQPLEAALRALQSSSGVAVAFSPDVVPAARRVTCDCAQVTVRVALERLLTGTGLVFRASGRQVLVGAAPEAQETSPAPSLIGVVVEAGSGRALSGAQVSLPELGRSMMSSSRPSGSGESSMRIGCAPRPRE